MQPLRTKLWDKYSGNKLTGLSTYLTALSPSFEDVISFTVSRDVDESCCMGDDIAHAHGRDLKEEWYDSPPGMQSADIGFLFLVLESSMQMSGITFEWRQYINPLQERQFSTDALTTPLASWNDPAHEALTDELIAQTAPILQSMKIASAKKEESFIWFLGAYRASKTGLPEFWLTDVSVPVQATAFINGKSVTQLFRKPYLDKAAKVSVPNGWFHQ